jgi:hypothetical protein
VTGSYRLAAAVLAALLFSYSSPVHADSNSAAVTQIGLDVSNPNTALLDQYDSFQSAGAYQYGSGNKAVQTQVGTNYGSSNTTDSGNVTYVYQY